MATLTSSYQYLGRSSVMSSTSGSLSYYILLYGKTSANQTTGIHTVTIKEVLASTNTNATYYYYTQAHNGKINGTTAFSGTNKPSTDWNKTNLTEGGVTYKTWIMLGEGSVNVDATDGNAKNITLSCYYAFNDTATSYTPAYGTSRTVSVTATLAAIPRATTPTISASPYTMGTALTINLAPANSTFKHKIGYDFGNLKGQTSGLSIGTNFTAQGNTSVTFNPPTSLGNQIPSANSGTCTIYCYTYTSGGTHIGTKSATITINVPSYTPEINNVTLTGNNLLSGVYVQGKSQVTVNAQPKTYYGAGTKSVVAETDGKQYKTLPFTSAVLSSGNRIVKITFTDTRNKSVTYTSSAFTVYPYSAPEITAFHLERQADGTTVIASMSGSISPLNNKNSKGYSITLNGVTNYLNVSGYEVNGSTTFTNVPTDNSLTATAKLADYYTTTSKNAVLPTVAVTMDFHNSGTGVAFGKVSEHSGYLDVAWNAQFNKYVVAKSTMFSPLIVNRADSDKEAAMRFENSNGVLGYIGMMGDINGGLRRWTANSGTSYLVLDAGNTKDFVIERGVSNGWTYKKWENGEIEAYQSVSVSTAVATTYGNGFYNGSTLSVNLPTAFVNNAFPIININAQSTQAQILDANIASYNQAERKISYYISSHAKQATAYQVWVHFRVVGKWK